MKNNNGGSAKPKKKIHWKALSNSTSFKFKDNFLHSNKGGENSVYLPSTMVDDVDYSLEIPISTTSGFFPTIQENNTTITSLISKYNILPSGVCNYKDDKSKEGVEGFIFMDYINKFELHLLDILDNNPKLKNSIYAKAGIDFRKHDPKIKIIDSGLFVSSISQPLHKDEDLAGQDDTSKSPIMPIEIWMDDAKVDTRTGEPNMNGGIVIREQKKLIYTTVRVHHMEKSNVTFPSIKTWEDFETCCVYYECSAEYGGPLFFKLVLASEVFAPSLFFNKNEIKFQWKLKFITIFEKQEINRQVERTPEEDAEEYKAYLVYVKKYLERTDSQESLTITAPANTTIQKQEKAQSTKKEALSERNEGARYADEKNEAGISKEDIGKIQHRIVTEFNAEYYLVSDIVLIHKENIVIAINRKSWKYWISWKGMPIPIEGTLTTFESISKTIKESIQHSRGHFQNDF
jgi:hypothetical protein